MAAAPYARPAVPRTPDHSTSVGQFLVSSAQFEAAPRPRDDGRRDNATDRHVPGPATTYSTIAPWPDPDAFDAAELIEDFEHPVCQFCMGVGHVRDENGIHMIRCDYCEGKGLMIQPSPEGLLNTGEVFALVVAGAGYAECYTTPETYWIDLR